MEAVELKEISRSINSAVGGFAGQFREASERSNRSLTTVIKDLYKAMTVQGDHITELDQSIDEVGSTSRQTASKIDSTNSILEQTLNVQNNIYSVMRTMGYDIKNMNENVKQINSGSMLGTMLEQTGIGGFLKNAMGMLAGGAMGATAGAALGNLFGGASPMQITGSATEAMSFFQTKGWSKEQSAGIVGNLMVESENFSPKVLSGEKKGDGGAAVGVAQWHPDRQRLFESVMHKPLIGSSFKDQLEFVNWELNNSESGAGNRLRTAGTAGAAAAVVDEFYERSSGEHRGKRIANAESLYGSKAETAATTQATSATPVTPSTQTPSITTPQNISGSGQTPTAVPMAGAGGGEGHGGGHSHGIISGAMGGGEGQGKLSGVQPGILEKFNQINSQAGIPLTVTSGFRDPEHNAAVGGAKNSAHTRGNAVDVHFNGGVEETNKLIKTASAAGIGGIGVYRPGVLHFDTEEKRAWGPSYHSDSIPDWARPAIQEHLGGAGAGRSTGGYSETGGGMAGAVGGAIGGMRPLTSYASLTGSGVTPNLGNMGAGGAIAQAAMGGAGSVQNMGGMGGTFMGGMAPTAMALTGLVAPILMRALESGIRPEQPMSAVAELEPPETFEAPADVLKNIQIEREIESQNAAKAMANSTKETAQKENTVYINQSSSGQSQYGIDYNHESDRGWPDWVSQFVGNQWEESKKVVFRM